MSDLISRQAAIDAIMEEPSEVRYPVYYAEKIRHLPSAQQWIPVTERLPKEHEMVIVTIAGSDLIVQMDGETIKDAIDRTQKTKTVTVGFIGSDGWYGADWYPIMVRPSAWMPLPMPWEGGEADA